MDITKKDFEDYERIRQSGRTNMFDVNTVVALSVNLTKEKCYLIMKRYSELAKIHKPKGDINERNQKDK